MSYQPSMKYVNVCYLKGKPGNRKVVYVSLPLAKRITPLAKEVFSSGQCHALALALHDILGWPIKGTFSEYHRRTSHYVVESPKRHLTGDIEGLRCVDFYRRHASPDVIRKGTNKSLLPLAYDAAKHYAELLVKDIVEKDNEL